MKLTSARSRRSAAALSLGCLLLGTSTVTAQSAGSGTTGNTAATPSSQGISTNASKHEMRFLMKAHASGMRELQLSQLAVTRATNPQVKSFAQQMVTEHQQMGEEMKPLLTAAGLDANLPSGVVSSASGRTGGTQTYGGTSSAVGSSSSGAAGTASTRDTSATGMSGAMHPEDKKRGSMSDRWSRMMGDRKQQNLAKKTGKDFDEAYMNLMVDEHQDAVDLFEDAVEDNPSPQVQAFASKYLPKLQQHLTHAKQVEEVVD